MYQSSAKLIYQDMNELNRIQKKLSTLPSLIDYNQINELTAHLINASHRQAFIFQAGDCAERFSDAESYMTRQKYEQLIFLKALIENKIELPVSLIGRIAGQYAKPRSVAFETFDENPVYAYHGDMINAENPIESRNPDPNRILQAYAASKKVLFDITKFEKLIFTSHECFLLEYEEPLTRVKENTQYNLSTHLPWLGMRNIKSEKHIRYLANIFNPIAIKIGPNTAISSLISIIQRINPKNKIGKIVLITRLGFDKVTNALPELIEAINKYKFNIIWMCDPLHGNTQVDKYGKKFRLLKHAVDETIMTSSILYEKGEYLSGLHLEISPKKNILECVTSLDELTPDRVYESALDPRLNYNQCIAYLEQVLESIYVAVPI